MARRRRRFEAVATGSDGISRRRPRRRTTAVRIHPVSPSYAELYRVLPSFTESLNESVGASTGRSTVGELAKSLTTQKRTGNGETSDRKRRRESERESRKTRPRRIRRWRRRKCHRRRSAPRRSSSRTSKGQTVCWKSNGHAGENWVRLWFFFVYRSQATSKISRRQRGARI